MKTRAFTLKLPLVYGDSVISHSKDVLLWTNQKPIKMVHTDDRWTTNRKTTYRAGLPSQIKSDNEKESLDY